MSTLKRHRLDLIGYTHTHLPYPVLRMEKLGVLDNTYILFTSDNGFHLGHHSLAYEKFTLYEEDVRVPLFMRGPDLPKGVTTDYQVCARVDMRFWCICSCHCGYGSRFV